VQAILADQLADDSAGGQTRPDESALCRCAAAIVTAYGTDFHGWLADNFQAGNSFENLTAFTPGPVLLCAGFTFEPGTGALIETLLQQRYQRYTEVSYRLWAVVNLLGRLTSIYPPATLHDCDDGSDDNPVRLGQTALGS
jgi:hypothetical protein